MWLQQPYSRCLQLAAGRVGGLTKQARQIVTQNDRLTVWGLQYIGQVVRRRVEGWWGAAGRDVGYGGGAGVGGRKGTGGVMG